jgi:hypothetical protein
VAGDGWTASSLQHAAPVKPIAPQLQTAEKPISPAASEAIPSPAAAVPSVVTPAEPSPTVAPAGPAVEPAPPAHDPRDLPATKASGAGFLKPIPTSDHTT